MIVFIKIILFNPDPHIFKYYLIVLKQIVGSVDNFSNVIDKSTNNIITLQIQF